jgi:hypothetical protein
MPLEQDGLELVKVKQRNDAPSIDSHRESRQILLHATSFLFVHCFGGVPTGKILQHLIDKLAKIVGFLGSAHEDE